MRQKESIVVRPRSHVAPERMEQENEILACCDCAPLFVPCEATQSAATADIETTVLVSQELRARLHALLDELCSRSVTVSALLLHMSQREAIPLKAAQSTALYKRRRYHAPATLFEQVLANVQRVIRTNDTLLIRVAAGAAIAFPDVDQIGARHILTRVCNSLSLLQAETMVPPLTYETLIQVGVGSYPDPAPSIEAFLATMGCMAHSLTLRPSITEQLRSIKPGQVYKEKMAYQPNDDTAHTHKELLHTPFMILPPVLPARVKQLIPYAIARELRCVPVGRDQRRLTVAMAEPTRSDSVQYLQKITGMTIFLVSCEEQALDTLLTIGW